MQDPRKKKVSPGTVLMIFLTILILGGTAFVLARMSSGAPTDLWIFQQKAEDLKEIVERTEDNTDNIQQSPAPTAAASATIYISEKETPAPEKYFTLTIAGTVSLSGEVRKNSYFSDVKQYDYFDVMMLMKKDIQSDLNIVFLENLLTHDSNATDVIASAAGAEMLKNAGFNVAACGFSKAFDKEEGGIKTTRNILKEWGIQPVGIYENVEDMHFLILTINGIDVAIIQYTETIPSGTRKSMMKKGINNLIPAADADALAADIYQAKAQEADVVLVLLNWGTAGKTPDKSMRTLAQSAADSGADMIIGNGSRIVSGAEMLTAAESGRQVPCIWSLGTVLSGDRSNIKRIAGMMIQATISGTDGNIVIRDMNYIPLYTWKYKQDGRYQYRCMAADGSVPDGMDTDQQKMMKKAADTVQNAMKDAPLGGRTDE